MKRILVTGGSGLVGSSINKIKNNYRQHYEFIFVSSKDYDLTNYSSVQTMFDNITVFINKNRDIVVIILLFLILNTQFIINLINNKILLITINDNIIIYLNLFIRCLLLGIILYIIKINNLWQIN